MPKRANFLINKPFQFKMIIIFALIIIFSSNLTAALIYAFLSGAIDLSSIISISPDNIILPSIVIAQIISILFILFLGIFITHTLAGPIYRFEKAIKMVSDKDLTVNFSLRKNDEFQHLAGLINNMVKRLNSELLKMEKTLATLKDSAEQLPGKKEHEVRKHTEDMRKAIFELTSILKDFKLK